MIKDVIAGVPEDYRERFRARLAYAYEPFLADRIREILVELGAIVQPYYPQTPKFVQEVVGTRNYYTHYDPSTKNEIREPSKLRRVTESLVLIGTACVLVELGLKLDHTLWKDPLRAGLTRYWASVSEQGEP